MTTAPAAPPNNRLDPEGRQVRVCKNPGCEFHGIQVRTALTLCLGSHCGQPLETDSALSMFERIFGGWR